jgi:hypothetical protein
MSAVIAWTCKLCGYHADNLSVDEYMTQDNNHVCRPADIIRRAVGYFRARAIPTGGAIADWLESCAGDAEGMRHAGDFSRCDEPGSVRHALAVAMATPWTETP